MTQADQDTETRRLRLSHKRIQRNPLSIAASTAAELVAAVSLIAFCLIVWPPAALLVIAGLAGAYAWQNR